MHTDTHTARTIFGYAYIPASIASDARLSSTERKTLYAVIALLQRGGRATPTQLADHLRLPTETLTSILERLDGFGYSEHTNAVLGTHEDA